MGHGNVLTVLAKALDVKFDCLTNEAHRIISCLAGGHASRQVGYVCTKGLLALLNDHDVFHAHSFLNPACFQMLPSVPVGTSTPALPATVTAPRFDVSYPSRSPSRSQRHLCRATAFDRGTVDRPARSPTGLVA